MNGKNKEMLLRAIRKMVSTNPPFILNGTPSFRIPDIIRTGIYRTRYPYYTVIQEFIDQGIIGVTGDNPDRKKSRVFHLTPEGHGYTFFPEPPIREQIVKIMKEKGTFSVPELSDAGFAPSTIRRFLDLCVLKGYVENIGRLDRRQRQGQRPIIYQVVKKQKEVQKCPA